MHCLRLVDWLQTAVKCSANDIGLWHQWYVLKDCANRPSILSCRARPNDGRSSLQVTSPTYKLYFSVFEYSSQRNTSREILVPITPHSQLDSDRDCGDHVTGQCPCYRSNPFSSCWATDYWNQELYQDDTVTQRRQETTCDRRDNVNPGAPIKRSTRKIEIKYKLKLKCVYFYNVIR